MNFKEISGIKIYRPDVEHELSVRQMVVSKISSKYPDGVYTDPDEIDSIIKDMFTIYNGILEKYLPFLISRGFVEFLLQQYDNYAEIERKKKAGLLSQREMEFWSKVGAEARRSIKFMIEKSILTWEDKNICPENIDEIFAICWVSSENLVKLYILSDQTHSIFSKVSLFYLDSSYVGYYEMRLDIEFDLVKEFKKDIDRDLMVKSISSADEDASVLQDIKLQSEMLESEFSDYLGISYGRAVAVIANIVHNSQSSDDFPSVRFINKEYLINAVGDNCGLDCHVVRKIIDGFSLGRKDMEDEVRVIFKPKQEYRALRRGFFIVPDLAGDHVAFSEKMVEESLMALINNVAFRKLPKEWLSDAINKKISLVSNKAGKWFEDLVEKKIKAKGIASLSSIKKIRNLSGKNSIIPHDVGEIDLLGYCHRRKTLFLVECKLVKPAFEARYYLDDVSSFIDSDKSYKVKFLKKIRWLEDNMSDVEYYLRERGIVTAEVSRVEPLMVTYYPTIMKYFIKDFKCISLSDFLSILDDENFRFPINQPDRKDYVIH